MPLLRRISLFLLACGISAAAAESIDLFDDFAPDWRSSWQQRSLFTKATSYQLVTLDGRAALHAFSRHANATLLREVAIPNPVAGTHLSWQWRIKSPLNANYRERTRGGDDYAARICIVFEESLIPLRTRALSYVWAAHEPEGVIFPSPYSSRVGMIVLRSGNTQNEVWLTENRDVFADYRRFFGTDPSRITAVGIVVDTDNTDAEAEAWFRKLVLSIPDAKAAD